MKPGNIFLLKDSMQVKIGDFGLACLDMIEKKTSNFVNISSENSAFFNLSNQNVLAVRKEHTKGVGTSQYASPEQLSGKLYDSKVKLN